MAKKELITLNPKTDFTPKQLKDFLEQKYNKKSSGKNFTNQDVYAYALRGRLPDAYSGKSIEILNFKGVRMYRLHK